MKEQKVKTLGNLECEMQLKAKENKGVFICFKSFNKIGHI